MFATRRGTSREGQEEIKRDFQLFVSQRISRIAGKVSATDDRWTASEHPQCQTADPTSMCAEFALEPLVEGLESRL